MKLAQPPAPPGVPHDRPPAAQRGDGAACPEGNLPGEAAARRPGVNPPSSRPEADIPFVPRALRFTVVPLAAILIAGLPYYILPLHERIRSPLHPWLRPSGFVGQSAGILAFLFFSFLWLYPLRKKLKVMARTGPLGKWLDVHVVVGLLVPFVAGIHAAWRFTGLIGLGYASMVVVSLSGIVGRYLYVHIPRRRSGLEMSRDEVISERHALIERIAQSTGLARERIRDLLAPTNLAVSEPSLGRSLMLLVRDDIARRRAISQLLREWREAGRRGARPDPKALREVKGLARREMALSQQIRMLSATLRVFRFWHAAHRPFAITAFVAVTLHVIVVVALGATWFW